MKCLCKINLFPKNYLFFSYFQAIVEKDKIKSLKTNNELKVIKTEDKKDKLLFLIPKIVLLIFMISITMLYIIYNKFSLGEILVNIIFITIIMAIIYNNKNFEFIIFISSLLLTIINYFFIKSLNLKFINLSVLSLFFIFIAIFMESFYEEYETSNEFLFFKTLNKKFIIKCKCNSDKKEN